MIKHIVAFLVLSIILVLGMPYAQQAIQWLIMGHNWILQYLGDVFSGGQAGSTAKAFIALVALPIVIGLIPALIYWLIRHRWCPFFMEFVWIVWLLEVGALAAIHQTAVAAVL